MAATISKKATRIRVPQDKAHTPPAQSIAQNQAELKRLKTKQKKRPSPMRQQKIQEYEARLVGSAEKQGWLLKEGEARDSLLCNSCDIEKAEDDDAEADHQAPSLKSCCVGCCGFCPCAFCKDTVEVDLAYAALEDLDDNRQQVVDKYKQKGMSEADAQTRFESKKEKAETAVVEAEKEMEIKKQTKFSQSVGICQTAIAMPCMVGM